jgi:hypothetical protein
MSGRTDVSAPTLPGIDATPRRALALQHFAAYLDGIEANRFKEATAARKALAKLGIQVWAKGLSRKGGRT